MAGNRPEERVRGPAVFQGWRDVTFVHWRYEPEVIARFLPEGVSPDVVDGSAWVSLTPFRIEGFRPPLLPTLPFWARLCETNLRTYVRRDRDGTDAIWFFSLDVTSASNVLGGRTIAVPYFLSRMAVDVGGEDGVVRYRSRRLVGPKAAHDISVRPSADGGVGEIEEVLAGRWRAFSRVLGRLAMVPVEHEPWPLRPAELVSLEETVVAAAGLPPPAGAPLVAFADGVDARLGPPRLA